MCEGCTWEMVGMGVVDGNDMGWGGESLGVGWSCTLSVGAIRNIT